MNSKLLGLLCATLPLGVVAQIDYNGGVYWQDFDTLSSGTIYTYYTNLPAGWVVSSTFNSGSYVWTTVTNGFSDFGIEMDGADSHRFFRLKLQ